MRLPSLMAILLVQVQTEHHHKAAVVTLVASSSETIPKPSYLLGAVYVGRSLRQVAQSVPIDSLALYAVRNDTLPPAQVLELFAEENTRVLPCPLPKLKNTNNSSFLSSVQKKAISSSVWHVKAHIFRLVDYTVVVYLDADVVVLADIGPWTTTKAPFIINKGILSPVNNAFIVVRPNMEVYADLQRHISWRYTIADDVFIKNSWWRDNDGPTNTKCKDDDQGLWWCRFFLRRTERNANFLVQLSKIPLSLNQAKARVSVWREGAEISITTINKNRTLGELHTAVATALAHGSPHEHFGGRNKPWLKFNNQPMCALNPQKLRNFMSKTLHGPLSDRRLQAFLNFCNDIATVPHLRALYSLALNIPINSPYFYRFGAKPGNNSIKPPYSSSHLSLLAAAEQWRIRFTV
eukprot:CAMPEP_0197361892 /NCGR_PEP_ID=MMETSP0893-20130614/63664_1 /TAXON_ID=44058 ORGANISM="Aureoumbra lagunensis, Strain CCMP1510" /NCGR_SAMPLE_ID=MMETSP0893 /ASSEMBLY_ACC=CAM_ASM_000539 /LENGTH=406 /DNA_ID=CAMNT_0042883535 /DNA_START=1798 /DNA_END=3018 /DNA_ORIENTATION=-